MEDWLLRCLRISAEIRKSSPVPDVVNTPRNWRWRICCAPPEHYRALRFLPEKRDVLVNALAQSRLKVLPCEGYLFSVNRLQRSVDAK